MWYTLRVPKAAIGRDDRIADDGGEPALPGSTSSKGNGVPDHILEAERAASWRIRIAL